MKKISRLIIPQFRSLFPLLIKGSRKTILGISLFFLLLGSIPTHAIAEPNPVQGCIYYRVQKYLTLIPVEVLGKNCFTTFEWVRSGNKYRGVLYVPSGRFDTGNFARDSSVADILARDGANYVRVETEALTSDVFTTLDQNNRFLINCSVYVGKDNYPVKMPVYVLREGNRLDARGELTSTFSHFGITPPDFAGGLLMQVENQILLAYSLSLPMPKTD